MRAFVIRRILPVLFTLVPVAAAVLVVAAVPQRALDFYLGHVRDSYLDWFILGLGAIFFVVQLALTWRALTWRECDFDTRFDDWLRRLQQTSDWFPLLGLFGTLVGILQTFSRIAVQEHVKQQEIVQLYAPSLTTAASGLLMAFLNLLPLWLSASGRGLILSLAVARQPGTGGPGRWPDWPEGPSASPARGA